MHSNYVVSSTFGGQDSNFIASGSEGLFLKNFKFSLIIKCKNCLDSFLVIWNINQSQPIRRLAGHMGIVNAVQILSL